VQDSSNLTYERENPTSDYALKERIAKNLPSKPRVITVNLFNFVDLNDDRKIEYLKSIGLTPVGGDIDKSHIEQAAASEKQGGDRYQQRKRRGDENKGKEGFEGQEQKMKSAAE